ncbi:XdhC family protein [Haladaptatus sp. DFWS20]|uniref:XdhC family protein n=1 Tax=Haladaptatus sp. DFWS20 TaxID=3403467 RepID=UPI003EBAD70B
MENSWSVPQSTVLSRTRELLMSDQAGVLVSVVDVEGSAYRRPGVKMLVPEDGRGIGSITAGCLEDEVVRLANSVLEAGRPRLETFDLTNDDDVWGLGIGCNGVIDLLVEPVDKRHEPLFDAHEAEQPIVSVTVLDSEASDVDAWQRTYFRPDGSPTADSKQVPPWLIDAISERVTALTNEGQAGTVDVDGPNGSVRLFIDSITPPPTFVTIGTGHDIGPVVDLANRNGFRTVLVGFRGAVVTEDRIAVADETVSTSPRNIREVVDFDEETYVVVMSHNFVDDRLVLDELVRTPVPYVGLMGPHKRFEEMLSEFDSEGRTLSEVELAKVYTPVGLDLGSETPYQIAHSIVAEVLAVHNERTPRHLKDRVGSIHERTMDTT